MDANDMKIQSSRTRVYERYGNFLIDFHENPLRRDSNLDDSARIIGERCNCVHLCLHFGWAFVFSSKIFKKIVSNMKFLRLLSCNVVLFSTELFNVFFVISTRIDG